jgi:ubiquinone/menaquinone biosynthesis C-methylase UbiE
LAEAHRVLKPFGLLFVAELAKRWEEGRLEQAVKGHVFNLMFSYQCDNFRYLGAVKGVV